MIRTTGMLIVQEMTEPDHDAAWVRAAKAGQVGAFEELVNRYKRRIYRLGINITGRPEEAEEVLQETFLKALSGGKIGVVEK